MALEGTHMRFALDIQNNFNITDINKYLSGTIYPDSRYISGIDRNLTHDKKFIKKGFYKDSDFKKGWAAHLVYDHVQYDITAAVFEDYLKDALENQLQNWCKRTAFKIVQDIEDISKFDIKTHLKSLKYIENPNNENLKKVEIYNESLINLYKNPQSIRFKDYEKMWRVWGVKEKSLNDVHVYFKEIKESAELMSRVIEIYPKTLSNYKSYLK